MVKSQKAKFVSEVNLFSKNTLRTQKTQHKLLTKMDGIIVEILDSFYLMGL